MATRVQIEKNKSRRKLVERYASKRSKLKTAAKNPKLSAEDRFQARLKLAELPRNSAPNRVRNRCELTGRSRSVYRKFKLSRLKLRELASNGQIPGAVKASW